MARKTPSVVPPQPKMKLTSQEIDRGLARLSERIAELHAFDLNTVRNGNTPELKTMQVAIKDSLTRCFGEDTSAYRTYAAAADLTYYPMIVSTGQQIDYYTPIQRRVQNSIALLEQAQKSLKEDLADLSASGQIQVTSSPEDRVVHSGRVFVVHGHDEGARESVARFLEKLGLGKLRTSCPSAGNGRLGDAEKTDFQPQIIGKPRHSLGFLPSRAHLSCRRQ